VHDAGYEILVERRGSSAGVVERPQTATEPSGDRHSKQVYEPLNLAFDEQRLVARSTLY
jgi:hypothetical protein